MSLREDVLKTAENLRWDLGERIHDHTVEALSAEASRISARTVSV